MILSFLSFLRPGASPGDAPARRMRRNFIYHLHPVRVSQRALHPLTTLGLGIISVTLFLVLAVTGALLMIYYIPTTREAYGSMQDIQFAVTFGAFVRALHRWAAHGMVAVVLLHLARVVLTGSYARRHLNWLIGMGLGIATLGLAFTGYLLPWDQLSFWAVNVSATMLDTLPLAGPAIKTLMLGGEVITQATLLRFYMLHVALLPAGVVLLLALHLWRMRKDGGLAASASSGATVEAWPHLVLREAVLVLVVLTVICLVSVLFSAPLGTPPDFHMPDNPEKAPWYFLGLQEMVSYSAAVGGVVFPGVLLIGLLIVPFAGSQDEQAGRWFGSRAARRAGAIAFLVSVCAFCLFEAIQLGVRTGAGSPWTSDLLNPASGMIAVALATAVTVRLVSRSTRAAILSGFVVMLVALAGFTAMGLCRGPDWVFYWPWEDWPIVL